MLGHGECGNFLHIQGLVGILDAVEGGHRHVSLLGQLRL